MSCCNDGCNRDPFSTGTKVLVNADGDFACSPECKKDYERKRDHFLNNVVHDEGKTARWLQGGENPDD